MILLDTHVWIWWLSEPARLSAAADDIIREAMAGDGVAVSSFSVWELTLLVARGRLELCEDPSDWIARSEALPFLRFVPVDNAIAAGSVRLPDGLHADPADRIIVATARSLRASLVTKDERLWRYPHVTTVW